MANKKKEPNEKRTIALSALWSEKEIEAVGGRSKANKILADARDKAYINSIKVTL